MPIVAGPHAPGKSTFPVAFISEKIKTPGRFRILIRQFKRRAKIRSLSAALHKSPPQRKAMSSPVSPELHPIGKKNITGPPPQAVAGHATGSSHDLIPPCLDAITFLPRPPSSIRRRQQPTNAPAHLERPVGKPPPQKFNPTRFLGPCHLQERTPQINRGHRKIFRPEKKLSCLFGNRVYRGRILQRFPRQEPGKETIIATAFVSVSGPPLLQIARSLSGRQRPVTGKFSHFILYIKMRLSSAKKLFRAGVQRVAYAYISGGTNEKNCATFLLAP